MLKQRVITAILLIAFVLIALLNPNPVYWQAFVIFAVSLGFYEWLKFCDIQNVAFQVGAFAVFFASVWALNNNLLKTELVIWSLCVLWVLLLTFTLRGGLQFLHQRWLKLLVGVLILSAASWLIVEFKKLENGPWWILCFFVSVWAADVGAYFVGRRFGKTKLAPSISPGKTVEGLFGGLALVMLVFVPILFFLFNASAALLLLATVLVTALVSVGGDLFESKLKRHVALKDSSQILPGHGGVLDRIDSLLSAAPFFSAGLLLLGYLG